MLVNCPPRVRSRTRTDSDGELQRGYTLEFSSEEDRDEVLRALEDPQRWVSDYLTAAIDSRADKCWIQTYSKEAFFPANPDPDKIHIKDIAHSLSNLSRYCGHTNRFYSVAEHSLFVAHEMVKKLLGKGKDLWSIFDLHVPDVGLQMIRAAFLHDAPEAYIGDVTSPLKRMCPGYKIIEKRVELAVQKRFGLIHSLGIEEIVECDIAVFLAEKPQLMGDEVEPWGVSGEPADTGLLHCWAPQAAEEMFLRAATCLGL